MECIALQEDTSYRPVGYIVQLLGPPVVQTQVVVAVGPAEWTVGTTGLGQVSPAATQGTEPMSLTYL